MPDHAQAVTATLLVNGIRLHQEERGEGTPILGIHGCGGSAVFWERAMGELARLGRAISYDRRGNGRSERPAPYERVSVAQHADDAAALLEALGAAPAVVIGRSYGGEVATDLALRYPERVRALVLLEGVPVLLHPGAEAYTRALADRLRAVAAASGSGAVGEALVAEVAGAGAWESLPEELRRVLTENGPAILAELNGEWLRVDARAIATIHQPVLLVGAAGSHPALRDPNDAMATALPHARTVVLGGGHLIDPAAPEVLAFVREVLGAA